MLDILPAKRFHHVVFVPVFVVESQTCGNGGGSGFSYRKIWNHPLYGRGDFTDADEFSKILLFYMKIFRKM